MNAISELHHFLLDCRKLKEWILDRGWIARGIQLSKKGIKQLVKRAFREWRFDIQANVYAEAESRGVSIIFALNYKRRQVLTPEGFAQRQH